MCHFSKLTRSTPYLLYHSTDYVGDLKGFIAYFWSKITFLWNFDVSDRPQSHIWDFISDYLIKFYVILNLLFILLCYCVFCITISPSEWCLLFWKNMSTKVPQSHIWDRYYGHYISSQNCYNYFFISQYVSKFFGLKLLHSFYKSI